MRDLITALGLVLVIEGLLYAVNPSGLKHMLALMREVPDQNLRVAGIGAVAVGFFIVWMTRNGIMS